MKHSAKFFVLFNVPRETQNAEIFKQRNVIIKIIVDCVDKFNARTACNVDKIARQPHKMQSFWCCVCTKLSVLRRY